MLTFYAVGQKVTYVSSHGTLEHGIVKSFSEDPALVFVVYSCSGNWGDYKNYTAAATPAADLVDGWR